LNHKILKTLIVVCFFSLSSCGLGTHHTGVNAPQFPARDTNLSDPEICAAQNRNLSEMEHLFYKKRFKKALTMGAEILKSPCSDESYLTALILIGDIFNARGEKTNAFYFYRETLAYESGKSQIRSLINRIATAVAPMKTYEILALINQIKNAGIQGQILFQTGVNKIHKGDEVGGIFLLKEFVKNFLFHKDRREAKSILRGLQDETIFKRNRIGVILPLSGYYETVGKKALKAIQMAVDEFNTSNNTLMYHIFVENSASDPTAAFSAVKKLQKQKVACIIGPMITASTAAIASNSFGIPMIALSQKSNVTEAGRFILRHFMTPAMQVEEGISYYIEKDTKIRFALLYPNERYGIAFKKAFLNGASQFDVDVSKMVSYEPSQTDFSEQIHQFINGYQKIGENGEFVDLEKNEKKHRNRIYRAKLDFDVLFIPDSAKMIAMIAPQLKYYGVDVKLMGTNLWHSEKLLQAKEYVQTAIFPGGFSPDSQSARVRKFVSSYSNLAGSIPTFTDAVAYDTAMIVMEAQSWQSFSLSQG